MAGKFPYRYRVLILLCGLTALTYLDRICISLVGVRMKADLKLSNEQFGWVLAAFSLAYALFELPSGAWGDRIGPRAVLIRIVLWWSLFTVLTGAITGLLSLMVIRFLFGVGEAGTYPNSLCVMSRWFPVKEMGRSLAFFGVGSQIGSALAPLMIVPLAAAYGWRVPFYVCGAIGIIWVICFSWFRNFPSEMRHISTTEKNYIESNRRFRQEHRLLSWKFILKHRNVWALMGMYFCCQWANYFFIGWMPIYLQEGRHFSENEMKIITATLFIAGIVFFLSAGFVEDWLVKIKGLLFGRRFVGTLGLGACGLLILLAGIVPQKQVAALCLILANGAFSFGVMVSYAVCSDIGRNNSGTVTGAMNFAGQTGAFFLMLLFGKMADAMHSFSYPVFLVGGVVFSGSLLWLVIDPRKQLAMDAPQPAADISVTQKLDPLQS